MKTLSLTLITLAFCAVSVAQTSADLKLNLEKNKIYRFTSKNEQTTIQTMNGNQQTVESSSSNTISLKMIDATPSFIVLEARFDTMKIKSNSMGKIVSMSSTSEGNIQSKETSDIMSYIMNRLSKNSVYAKLDYSGKVLEIVNAKMLSSMLMKDTSAITLTGPVGSAVKMQIAGLFSEGTLKANIEAFTSYLPGKSVTTGESWTKTEINNAGGMSLEITTNSHLDAIKENKANITSESSIKTAPNAQPMKSGVATITYDDLKGMSKSSTIIDAGTGLIIETGSKTHIAGNLGISGPGFSMQMPMDISSESKVVALK